MTLPLSYSRPGSITIVTREARRHAPAAAKTFEGHPHLQIPQSSIEVMEINPMHGM